jgi:hypothetical protein
MLQKEYEAKQKSVRAAFLQLHNWSRCHQQIPYYTLIKEKWDVFRLIFIFMGGKHRKENEICLIFLFGRCNKKLRCNT